MAACLAGPYTKNGLIEYQRSPAVTGYQYCCRMAETVLQEMYAQGDLERKMGLEVSPFMDREQKDNLCHHQLGAFVVL